MDLKLAGRKAIVTGGTRGIGRATVELLADEGCHVGFCARNPDQVEETRANLAGRGITAIGGAVDVADPAALKAWIDATAASLGGLDILVANVSALGVTNEPDTWRRSIEVDLMGTINTVEAALPHMDGTDDAGIVVVGTISTMEATSVQPYRSVKAALLPYVKAQANALARRGVRINVVSPGTVYFEGGIWNTIEENMPQMFEGALAKNPTGRMATPEEIASAIVFLASPRSSFTTGANLTVDGAFTVRVPY